jgi:hypothetical protein
MKDNNEAIIKSFEQMWGDYPELVLLLDKKHVIVAVNKVGEELGIISGINCFTLNKTDRMCKGCKAPLMHKEGKAQRQVSYNEKLGIVDGYWVPVHGVEGFYIHFGNNITNWANPVMFPEIAESINLE